MAYTISEISRSDRRNMAQVEALLEQEGIRLDANLDCICCMFDEEYQAVATGSCFGNTLRCFAVSREHQGEGLLNQIVGHLIQLQSERGNFHLFLYTKCETAKFFGDLGFYEIARAADRVVFMENRRTGFAGYLKNLEKTAEKRERVAALVMNANPFTLGHLYLVEKAAAENDLVHLFVVSEDMSLFPFAVRRQLVREGTAHLDNVVLHDSGPYIISSATFPSYFLKDEAAVIEGHARLDLAVFARIARTLHVTSRYVGDEPTSLVTGLYNQIMAAELPKSGVACVVVPRRELDGRPISASTVRRRIQDGDWESLRALLPETTLSWLRSEAASGVIERIRRAGEVAHY